MAITKEERQTLLNTIYRSEIGIQLKRLLTSIVDNIGEELAELVPGLYKVGASNYYTAGAGVPDEDALLNIILGTAGEFESAGDALNGFNNVGLGLNVLRSHVGNNNVVIGRNSMQNKTATSSVAIGDSVSFNGTDCVALGRNAGSGGSISNMFMVSNNSMPAYADRTAAETAISIGNGARPGTTYLYLNLSNNAIEGRRV